MAAISTRTAEVAVEYDFRKNGKTERRTKYFKAAHKARRFYCQKDEAGKNPKVLRGEAAKRPEPEQPAAVAPAKPTRPLLPAWSTVEYSGTKRTFEEGSDAHAFVLELEASGTPYKVRRATLAEALPSDPVKPGWKPTLIPTGDPTKTTYHEHEYKPFTDGDVLTEEQVVKEAKQKVIDPKKQAKQLKRKQKKNLYLWKTKDTKTLVKAIWQKGENRVYERWLCKFSDGTEEIVQNLAVVHSRTHEDHHIRIAGVGYIDGLTNKNYDDVLRRAADYARRAARRYAAGLANFRASPEAQKEMDKRISKKALKQEAPLEPTEIELAKKLADLANYYVTTPSAFFRDSEQLAKNVHTQHLANGVADGLLAKAGIDKLHCTIRVVQYANHLFNRMVTRLEIGGPQIGTPELAAEAAKAEKAAKRAAVRTETVVESNGDGTTTTKTKTVAPTKDGPEVDAFGNRVRSGKGDINAEILKHPAGTVFTQDMIDKIDSKTINTRSRTRRHFKKLAMKGFFEETKKGYKLLAGGAKATAAEPVAPVAKAKPKAKAAANRKAKPKAAQPAKAARKVAKKGTGKATPRNTKAATKAKGKGKAKGKARSR